MNKIYVLLCSLLIMMFTIGCEQTSVESEPITEEPTTVELDIESDQNFEVEVEEQPLNDEEISWPESTWPLKENYTPQSPEYADSISWYNESKNHPAPGGGYGWWVQPKADKEDTIYVYGRPLLSAKIVGEVETIQGPPNPYWWGVNELYQTETDVFFGVYRVKNEGYTWSLYRGKEGELGWIANEWVDLYAV